MKIVFKPMNYNSNIIAIVKSDKISTINDVEIVSLKFDNDIDRKRFKSLSIDNQKDMILCGYYQV